MEYAPVHEPKPWQETDFKNIYSDNESESDTDEEKQSMIEDDSEMDRNSSDIETSSVGGSDISDQDVILTNIFKNKSKKNHPPSFKVVLQEEEFFPE